MNASRPSGKVAQTFATQQITREDIEERMRIDPSFLDAPGCGSKSLLRRVLRYENSAVVARIAKEEDMPLEDAKRLFTDTLRFLWLAGTFGRISPPPAIDEGWHTFLMFTMDYQKFCHKFFGRFIHHRPNRSDDKPDGGASVRRSKALASEHLGELSENWKYPSGATECKRCTDINCRQYCRS